MDYRKTLNIPKISFPVKTEPSEAESRVLSFWNDHKIYESRQKLNKNKPQFILFNPPMPAYAQVSIQNALNMVLKDVTIKYKLMSGFDAPNFLIWDCYNSNIEFEALKLIGEKIGEDSENEIRRICRKLISEYISTQKIQLQKLGIFAYWNKDIMTSGSKSKLNAIEAFGKLCDAGNIQKEVKTTLWCVKCQTDLNGKEIEYKERELQSLIVKFPIIQGLEELGENVYIIVETSTPWTLSANTAVIVHPNRDYFAVEIESGEILILAENAVNHITLGNYKIIKRMKGLELDKILYAHPFLDRNSEVILGKRIPSDKGTGCIHSANKSIKGSRHRTNQEIISIVDSNGNLNEEAGKFCGMNVFQSSELISLELEKRGFLLSSEKVKELYPHCQYCKEPVIVKVADKWATNFNNADFRQRMFEVIDEVKWEPSWGKNNILNSITRKSGWNISRRRIWGVPIPAFYCSKCNVPFNITESIAISKDVIGAKGFNRWLLAEPNDILSDEIVCSHCGGRAFKWEPEILDSEFVSAMSYRLIPSNSKDPAPFVDICLQNGDQSNNLLRLSFLSSIAIEDFTPFKSVVLIGTVKGDNISLQNILEEFGADVFRLWAISMSCEKDLKISVSQLKLVYSFYKRIRNISAFLLSNLQDYDHEENKVDYGYLQEIDRWILHRLAKTVDKATEAYNNFQYHVFYHIIKNFYFLDMSNIYLSIVKRRLYTSPKWSSSRRAVQTVIYETMVNLVKLISPVLSFTAEELWSHIPKITDKYPSVFMSDWSDISKNFLNEEIDIRWKLLLKIRKQVYKSINKAPLEEGIKNSSQAYVMLYASDPNIYKLLEDYIDELETIFKVSKVRLMPPDTILPDEIWESSEIKGLAIEVRRATGEKCERCWIYSDTIGTNDLYPTLCYKCIATLEGGANYI